MKLILVRHAESEANLLRQFLSLANGYPLTELGVRQAEATAAALAGELAGVRTILTSPLERAEQTARILAAATPGIPVQPVEELQEVDVGDLEGLSEDDPAIMKRFRAAIKRFEEGDPEARFEGGESLDDIVGRCDRVRERIAGSEGPVLAVSHCLSLAAIIPGLMGDGGYNYRRYYVKKASVTVLEGEPGGMELLRLGDTSHLD